MHDSDNEIPQKLLVCALSKFERSWLEGCLESYCIQHGFLNRSEKMQVQSLLCA